MRGKIMEVKFRDSKAAKPGLYSTVGLDFARLSPLRKAFP